MLDTSIPYAANFAAQHTALRKQIIECIKAFMAVNKANHITLNTPIIYFVPSEDEECECITDVNAELEQVSTTHYGDHVQDVKLTDLFTDMLIGILTAIENEEYEIYEETEN